MLIECEKKQFLINFKNNGGCVTDALLDLSDLFFIKLKYLDYLYWHYRDSLHNDSVFKKDMADILALESEKFRKIWDADTADSKRSKKFEKIVAKVKSEWSNKITKELRDASDKKWRLK